MYSLFTVYADFTIAVCYVCMYVCILSLYKYENYVYTYMCMGYF